MGDEQKQCSLCNILASFSGRNGQGDESSEISSSTDSCGGENSVEEVKERRSKQRSKQMKKTTSSKVIKSNPAVNKNGKTGSAAKQQLSDVKKDGQSGAQTLDDQAEDSNQIEKPLTEFQKKLAKKTDNEKPTGGFKIKRCGSNGKAKVACAAAAGNAPRSFADAVRGWGSARGGGGGGPGLSARMAAVGEEAEEAPAPFEGGGGGDDDDGGDAVFLDPQLREEMLDFARCHFVLEMALFLVAVHDFSKLCTEHIEDEPTARQCHVEKAFEKYCDIVDEFIRQNSNHEINISHKMRASVMRFNRLGKKSFAAAPAFETRTIFKEPFEEVKKLFYTNYIVRFT